MDFLGHYYALTLTEKITPYSIIGVFLPDRRWGEKASVRGRVLHDYPDPRWNQLQLGVNHHKDSDVIFSNYIDPKRKELANAVASKGTAKGLWAYITAEYLIALSLDRELVLQGKVNPNDIADKISDVNIALVQSFCNHAWGMETGVESNYKFLLKRLSLYDPSLDRIVKAFDIFNDHLDGRFSYNVQVIHDLLPSIDDDFIERLEDSVKDFNYDKSFP